MHADNGSVRSPYHFGIFNYTCPVIATCPFIVFHIVVVHICNISLFYLPEIFEPGLIVKFRVIISIASRGSPYLRHPLFTEECPFLRYRSHQNIAIPAGREILYGNHTLSTNPREKHLLFTNPFYHYKMVSINMGNYRGG